MVSKQEVVGACILGRVHQHFQYYNIYRMAESPSASASQDTEQTHGRSEYEPQSLINDSSTAQNDEVVDENTNKRQMESEEPEAKRSHQEETPDYIQSLSRKEDPSTPGPASSSVYKDPKKEIPAWMKSKAQRSEANKYDKYGGRSAAAREQTAAASKYDKYAKYGAKDDRYLKYGAKPENTDSRVVRREEPEPERDPRRGPSAREPIEPQGDGEPPVAAYTSVPSLGGAGQKSEYRPFQSSIAHKENKDINSIVRQHYNQRTFQLRMQGSRTRSPIYKMRNFNNAIKYMLLGNHVKRLLPGAQLVLLDFCCGKGGDLNKCEFVHVDQYIGVDISDASVKEAYSRYSQNKARFIPQNPQAKRSRDSKRYNFEACFATGDLFTYSLPEILEPNFPGIMDGLFPVDCVSVQFSFHYAWETESKVRTVLTNITRSLRPGGTFIGTIPSSDFIREKIVNKEFYEKNTFGNDLYHVRFENDPPEDGVFREPFGNRYDYFLKDAVDDVPEYVVPFEYFRSLCEDFGLILRYKKNFTDIFNQEIPKYFNKLNKNLVDGMKRADGKYGVEGAEKEAVAFYVGFVFEKLGN